MPCSTPSLQQLDNKPITRWHTECAQPLPSLPAQEAEGERLSDQLVFSNQSEDRNGSGIPLSSQSVRQDFGNDDIRLKMSWLFQDVCSIESPDPTPNVLAHQLPLQIRPRLNIIVNICCASYVLLESKHPWNAASYPGHKTGARHGGSKGTWQGC